MENNKKKSCFICKLFKFIAVLAVIYAAVVTVAKIIEKLKKSENDKSNAEHDYKKLFTFFNAMSFCADEKKLSGVSAKSYASSLNIDVSEAELVNGAFISVKCLMSAVNITVPRNVNISFDALNCASQISNSTEAFKEDSELPVLYIAVNSSLSAVNIRYKEEDEAV